MSRSSLPIDEACRKLRANDLIDGRFRLVDVLGHGGMGVVWRAHDEMLELPVALKFLPDVVIRDATALEELKTETRHALRLTHPNILRVHNLVEDRERSVACIAMEFAAGGTLEDLRRGQPHGWFEPRQIHGWLDELCSALIHAHEVAGVVHRDLKPNNLLLDETGRLKIADFGFSARLSASVTQLARLKSAGTPAYASPQQIRGERATPSDDLYALGATIYCLLTGRPPFFRGDILQQLREATPTKINARRQESGHAMLPVSAGWENLVAQLLAKDPAKRPPDARAVAARLAELRREAAAARTAAGPAAAGAPRAKSMHPEEEIVEVPPLFLRWKFWAGVWCAALALASMPFWAGKVVGFLQGDPDPEAEAAELARANPFHRIPGAPEQQDEIPVWAQSRTTPPPGTTAPAAPTPAPAPPAAVVQASPPAKPPEAATPAPVASVPAQLVSVAPEDAPVAPMPAEPAVTGLEIPVPATLDAPTPVAPKRPGSTAPLALMLKDGEAPLPEADPPVRLEPSPQERFRSLIAEGKQLRTKGDPVDALVKLREAAALEPENPEGMAELALTFERMNLIDRAAEQWQRILEIGDSAGSYYLAAESRIKMPLTQALAAAQMARLSPGKAVLAPPAATPEPAPAAPSTQPLAGPAAPPAPPVAAATPPPPNLPRPANLPSGPVSATRPEASLGIGAVEREDDLNTPGRRLTLRIQLKARSDARINVADVDIAVLLFDEQGGGNVGRTDADVSYRFADPPVNWAGGTDETIEVNYDRTSTPAGKGQRKFFGYMVRLYHRGELQDVRAEPGLLAIKYPAPERFGTENGPAPATKDATPAPKRKSRRSE